MEPDWCLHEECLVGLFKSSIVNNKLRSCITGGSSMSNLSFTDFNYYSMQRKMQQIDYEMHKHIANLFFVAYGRRDSQSQCGTGSNTIARITGGTAPHGMTDTIGVDAAKLIDDTLALSSLFSWYKVIVDDNATIVSVSNSCCLGYEDIYGHKSEMMDNVGVPNNPGHTYKFLITMHDGSLRKVKGSSSTDVYVTAVAHGKYMDVISVGNAAGSSSTHYCDTYSVSQYGHCSVLRSGSYSALTSGLLILNANYNSSATGAGMGSRLGFRRQIIKAQSVVAYKAVVEIV